MAFIGVIAQGTMGSGVGRRLRESGAEVRTLLSGRSPASAERARVAGMVAAANEHELLSGADFFLSILPPGEAEPLARRLAPTLAALDRKPVYIDCNAVSPQTAVRIGEVIAPLEHRSARDRRADRRCLRGQDVVCRDHQRHNRDRGGDAAWRGTLWLR